MIPVEVRSVEALPPDAFLLISPPTPEMLIEAACPVGGTPEERLARILVRERFVAGGRCDP